MICADCGRAEVEVGAACPACGSVAVAVAPELLDSVLSLPAEPVPEEPDDADADGFVPLSVEPRVPLTTLDDEPSAEPWHDDRPEPAGSVAAAPPVEPTPVAHVAEAAEGAPVRPAADALPRRRPIAAVDPQWGPRQHPPAVLAPPPPHPLDAPPARVRPTQGTGLPAAVTTPVLPSGAMAPGGPTDPGPAPTEAVTSIPERPSHPRVRRWFGRGPSSEPEVPEAEPASTVPVAPAPVGDGPFVGAPEGLLDGVAPEADVGPGVRDPAGVEAAMSRMSSGARRSGLVAMGVVAALLEPGERAEAAVQGEYQHRPAMVVLTDRRVVVANDRRWAPDVRTFAFDPGLRVHGWQDERRATLVFELDHVGVVVDAISDRPLARDLAQRIRGRCAGEPPAV